MHLMLNLISLTRKISAFLLQISPRRPYTKGTVIILQRHSKRKTNAKFYMLINNPWLKLGEKILRFC